MTHICISKVITIGSENGLAPGHCQGIIWTSTGVLLIRTLGTNFSQTLSKNQTLSFKKMHLKMSSVKWEKLVLALVCWYQCYQWWLSNQGHCQVSVCLVVKSSMLIALNVILTNQHEKERCMNILLEMFMYCLWFICSLWKYTTWK